MLIKDKSHKSVSLRRKLEWACRGIISPPRASGTFPSSEWGELSEKVNK